jgi:uncharacterized lipoprotein YajG
MYIKIKLSILVATLFLTGCVVGTRNIDLAVPDYQNDKSSAGNIYIGIIEDSRAFEIEPDSPSTPSVDGDLLTTSKEALSTLVGRQRNGYGAAMGSVALPDGGSVQQEVRELMKEGLESRGYTVSNDENSSIKVSIEVKKFWAWFSPGMWAVSFESQLECKLVVESESGKKEFNVSGYGINKGQVASDDNWKLAYQRAFSDFLTNLDKTLDESGL